MSALLSLGAVVLTAAAPAPASFEDDLAFLRQHTQVIVLGDAPGARIAVVPAWQGRVATSTTGGPAAPSYGWINRELVASRKLQPHMNAFGGEDRIWLGPEGGQYSIFFKQGDPFDLEHWQTPPLIDSEPWAVAEQGPRHAAFRREGRLVNYSGTTFDFRLERTLRLLDRAAAARAFGASIPESLKLVAFESENVLVHTGKAAWTKPGGLLSIWILGMFTPTPRTTVAIPYREGSDAEAGPIVNDAYFGKVPADRLVAKDGVVFFKGDGEHRSKIGLSPARATPVLGSWDARAARADDRELLAARGRGRLRQLDVGDPEAALRRRRRQQLQRRPARAGRQAARAVLRARDLVAGAGARARRAPGARAPHAPRPGRRGRARRARAQRYSASTLEAIETALAGRPTR